jgi:hypothetical protein
MTASAMPSNPTCAGAFPLRLSIPPRDATFSRTSSAPPAAAIFWRTWNPVLATAPGSTNSLDTCIASFGGSSRLPRGRSNGFMDTRNPLSRVRTTGPRLWPRSETTGGTAAFLRLGDWLLVGIAGGLLSCGFLSTSTSSSSFLRKSIVTNSSSASSRC